MVTLIWAQGSNRELGLNNGLPWHEPADLDYFRETTKGSIVVMGRKTYESIGRVLPGRINVILTRDPEPTWADDNVWIYNSIPKLLNDVKNRKVFIIGGSEIYERFMCHASEIHVTTIRGSFTADVYAPLIDTTKFIIKDAFELSNRAYTTIYERVDN